jgi:4-carboxymuconolactone decarboxylase
MTPEPYHSSQTASSTGLDAAAEQARFDRGAAILREVGGDGGERVVDALADVAPALARQVIGYGYGEVYARPGLSRPQRQLVTISTLTALGGCEAQLEVHVNAALTVGLRPVEIVEAITHAAGYCGFPRALNAMAVAKRVFDQRGLLPIRPEDGDDPPPTTGATS